MIDFKIVIPSKNRIQIFKDNCLKFLINSNLIKNEIYLFVDSLDVKSYKKEFNNKYKIKVIEGKTGLINQRNYIRDYFNEDTNLLHLDDDLKNIEYDGNIDLNILISEDFKKMKENNILLGSINPTNNSFFKRNEYLLGLYLCVGCFFLEINSKNKLFYLDDIFNSEKEDYIRTIKHFCYSGQVYRNDYLNVKHKYNKNDDGGMNSNNRLENNNNCCDYINKMYPNLTSIFYKNKREKKEIRFKCNKYLFKKLHLDKKINSTLGKYYEDTNFKILDKDINYCLYDKKTKELIAVIIRNILEGDFDLNLLEKITKHGTCNRSDIAGEIDINKIDCSKKTRDNLKLSDFVFINESKTRARYKDKKFQMCNKFQSNNIGYYNLRGNPKLSVQSLKYDDEFKNKYKDTVKLIDNWSKLYYPENSIPSIKYLDTNFTGITINNNTRAANHKDNNNKDFCSMIVLGKFKGCNLLFTDFKLNLNINPNRDLLLFNSYNIKHCNSSYLDEDNKRYSLVFFKNKKIK